jgi:hypothetical protein
MIPGEFSDRFGTETLLCAVAAELRRGPFVAIMWNRDDKAGCEW